MQNFVLSIIITVVGGPHYLRKCIASLVPQIRERSIEIIVPYLGIEQEIQTLKQEFPQVTFFEIEHAASGSPSGGAQARHEIFDRGKSQGIGCARGQLIALLDDQGVPAADWCDRVLEMLHLPHGVVGGAIEHNGKGILNWAVYFTDFGRYQLPLREGPAEYLSDINICYKQTTLDAVRGTWAEKYNEVGVNWTLIKQGVVLWLNPRQVVQLDRGKLDLGELLRERYSWGRIFGSVRAGRMSPAARTAFLLLAPGIPWLIVFRSMFKVLTGKRNRKYFASAVPAMLVLAAAWTTGEWAGYLTGK
jgi:hypothetical protein